MALLKRFGNYSLFLIWGLFFLVSLFFATTPLTLVIGVLFLIYLPGFSLARLLKIEAGESRYETWMIYLGVGFVANLLICWFAVVFHANINILIISYATLWLVLFISALIFDLRHQALIQTNISAKEIFCLENLIYLVPLVLLVVILLTINLVGANFSGDPTYHLSIIRKVVDGGPFGIAELAFLKNQPQVQYAYPVWLVWLGFLAKVFHLSIASLWDEIIVAMTVIATLAWGWVFQKIFNLKLLAILAVSILLITSLANNAYLLANFAVPDTICKLFILPMSVALAFYFIDKKILDWKILGLTTLLLFLAAIIHSTQYVYFFFMMGAYSVVYALIFWRSANYKETLKRLVWLIIVPIVFFIPFLIFLQSQYHVLSDSLAWFATSRLILIYGAFKDYEPLMKLSFVLLPLTLLFWSRNPKILFLTVIMVITPLVYYFEPLREFISLKLSFVLVRRMFSNLVWYFGVLGLIGGFIILLLDHLVNFIKSDRTKLIFNIIIAATAIALLTFEYKLNWLTSTYRAIFGPNGSRLMEKNFVWVSVCLLVIALVLIIWQKIRKSDGFFTLQSPKNLLLTFILAIILIFWFTADARPLLARNLAKQAATGQFFQAIPDMTAKAAQTEDIGGDEVLAFVKNNLPKRPIFEASSGYRDLSQLADVYMSSWPGVWQPDKELTNLYRTDTPMAEKFACLSYYKVEYLLLTGDPNKLPQLGFSLAPQYFTLIFEKTYPLGDQSIETVQIYQIDTRLIQSDYSFAPGDQPPICRARKYRE